MAKNSVVSNKERAWENLRPEPPPLTTPNR